MLKLINKAFKICGLKMQVPIDTPKLIAGCKNRCKYLINQLSHKHAEAHKQGIQDLVG